MLKLLFFCKIIKFTDITAALMSFYKSLLSFSSFIFSERDMNVISSFIINHLVETVAGSFYSVKSYSCISFYCEIHCKPVSMGRSCASSYYSVKVWASVPAVYCKRLSDYISYFFHTSCSIFYSFKIPSAGTVSYTHLTLPTIA